MSILEHVTLEQLEAAVPHIEAAPKEVGVLELIVVRPAEDKREELEAAEITVEDGMVGDDWVRRPTKTTPDRSPNPDLQITLMNSRAIDLVAGTRERWALAGDQLYVDFDISHDNCPPGTRLATGSVLLEVTAQPHTGCKKFALRFGPAATKFFNSKRGKHLRLRGVNTRVVQGGSIKTGDTIRKLNE